MTLIGRACWATCAWPYTTGALRSSYFAFLGTTQPYIWATYTWQPPKADEDPSRLLRARTKDDERARVTTVGRAEERAARSCLLASFLVFLLSFS